MATNTKDPKSPSPHFGLSDTRALIAVMSVLFGTFTAVLNSRLTDIGLADLRGSLGIGFDEGSWITTAYIVAEATAVPATIWLRGLLSPVRCIVVAATSFSMLSLIAPASPSLAVLLAVQALRGFSAGVLIPMTYGVVMRYVKQDWRLVWLSFYAVVSGFTPSLAIFVEATIVNNLSWRFLFWLNLLPGAITAAAAAYGLTSDPVKYMHLRRPDLFGLATLSLGIASLVAALDQGNRLDWFNSGLVTGLITASAILIAGYTIHSLLRSNPIVGPQLLARRNFGLGIGVMLLTRFALMSTSFVVPQFLIRIQGYRALESSNLFMVAGVVQIGVIPCAAWLCNRIDVRSIIALGAITFGVGVLMAQTLTSAWATDQFLLPLLLQAIGSSFLAVPIMVIMTEDITMVQIPWAASWVHIVRTVGTALATALTGTFLRVREQFHSNLIGQHVAVGRAETQERLDLISSAARTIWGNIDGKSQAQLMLARTVQREAFVLAYADTALIIGLLIMTAAVISLFMRKTELPGRFL